MTTHMETRPDGVAVIWLDNKPVNSLASSLVKSFAENIQKAMSDSSIKAVVVTGKNKIFCGGAEIMEFEIGVRMGAKADDIVEEND